jgi:hypothetical protein
MGVNNMLEGTAGLVEIISKLTTLIIALTGLIGAIQGFIRKLFNNHPEKLKSSKKQSKTMLIFFIAGAVVFLGLENYQFKRKVDPHLLISVIKQEQSRYVKGSTGLNKNECFTDEDLAKFEENNTTMKLKNYLQNSKDFRNLVKNIVDMNQNDRTELFSEARNTYKPTFTEIGKVSSAGQTDAGQKAEKEIANTIVDLTDSLISRK